MFKTFMAPHRVVAWVPPSCMVNVTGLCLWQVVPEVAIAGKVFSNVTLHVQNVTTHFLNLVNGMTYYVSVRATIGGAQRLSSIASSSPVRVRHCMLHMGTTARVPKGCANITAYWSLETCLAIWLSSVFGSTTGGSDSAHDGSAGTNLQCSRVPDGLDSD